MRILFLLVLLAALVGCNEKPIPLINKSVVTIEVVDEITLVPDPNARGAAHFKGDTCHVQIKRHYYPACIEHEVRHCFEGNWHEGQETVRDCGPKN